jgi:hypothetical protein
MAKHRSYSVEFKRQVAQEYLAGETLHGLAKRHLMRLGDISRRPQSSSEGWGFTFPMTPRLTILTTSR